MRQKCGPEEQPAEGAIKEIRRRCVDAPGDALIGDSLLHRLGIHLGSGIIGLIINATIGAIVLLLALRLTAAGRWGGR